MNKRSRRSSSRFLVLLCLPLFSLTLFPLFALHLPPLALHPFSSFFFFVSVGMFSLSVVRAVGEVHSSSALLMFLFACLLCSVFWNSPSLCTPAETLRDTGKHPTVGSKHFYLSFTYRFRNSLRNKRTIRSWPELKARTIALFGCIWGFLFSQQVGLTRHLVKIL